MSLKLETECYSEDEFVFMRDFKRVYPHKYNNLIGVWQRNVQHHFPKDLITRMSDTRLLNAREFGLDCQDVNSRHGVDFLNDVIPAMIERVRSEGNSRKVRVLDSGCGLGFVADQIRARFGDQVKVFGTSLVRGTRVTARKRKMIEELRQNSLFGMTARLNGPIGVSAEIRDRILVSLGRGSESEVEERRMINTNDAKWRSMLELSDYPEFDLIIDTYGEMFYTDGISYSPTDFRGNFRKLFCAALKKLRVGGVLYVASLKNDCQNRFIEKNMKELEDRFGVKIEPIVRKIDGFILRGLIVKKL